MGGAVSPYALHRNGKTPAPVRVLMLFGVVAVLWASLAFGGGLAHAQEIEGAADDPPADETDTPSGASGGEDCDGKEGMYDDWGNSANPFRGDKDTEEANLEKTQEESDREDYNGDGCIGFTPEDQADDPGNGQGQPTQMSEADCEAARKAVAEQLEAEDIFTGPNGSGHTYGGDETDYGTEEGKHLNADELLALPGDDLNRNGCAGDTPEEMLAEPGDQANPQGEDPADLSPEEAQPLQETEPGGGSCGLLDVKCYMMTGLMEVATNFLNFIGGGIELLVGSISESIFSLPDVTGDDAGASGADRPDGAAAEEDEGYRPDAPSAGMDLIAKYDQMVDKVKPGIVVGILILALMIVFAGGNYNLAYAAQSGLPKIAFTILALAFFPEFLDMLQDLSNGLADGLDDGAPASEALVNFALDAGLTAAMGAAVIATAPTLGAILILAALVPVILLLLVVLIAGIIKNVVFGLLVITAPIALLCNLFPGLRAVTVSWFRGVMACFLIPVLYSLEVYLLSSVMAAPQLILGGGAGTDLIPGTAIIAMLVLLWVMYRTPFVVLGWAFQGIPDAGTPRMLSHLMKSAMKDGWGKGLNAVKDAVGYDPVGDKLRRRLGTTSDAASGARKSSATALNPGAPGEPGSDPTSLWRKDGSTETGETQAPEDVTAGLLEDEAAANASTPPESEVEEPEITEDSFPATVAPGTSMNDALQEQRSAAADHAARATDESRQAENAEGEARGLRQEAAAHRKDAEELRAERDKRLHSAAERANARNGYGLPSNQLEAKTENEAAIASLGERIRQADAAALHSDQRADAAEAHAATLRQGSEEAEQAHQESQAAVTQLERLAQEGYSMDAVRPDTGEAQVAPALHYTNKALDSVPESTPGRPQVEEALRNQQLGLKGLQAADAAEANAAEAARRGDREGVARYQAAAQRYRSGAAAAFARSDAGISEGIAGTTGRGGTGAGLGALTQAQRATRESIRGIQQAQGRGAKALQSSLNRLPSGHGEAVGTMNDSLAVGNSLKAAVRGAGEGSVAPLTGAEARFDQGQASLEKGLDLSRQAIAQEKQSATQASLGNVRGAGGSGDHLAQAVVLRALAAENAGAATSSFQASAQRAADGGYGRVEGLRAVGSGAENFSARLAAHSASGTSSAYSQSPMSFLHAGRNFLGGVGRDASEGTRQIASDFDGLYGRREGLEREMSQLASSSKQTIGSHLPSIATKLEGLRAEHSNLVDAVKNQLDQTPDGAERDALRSGLEALRIEGGFYEPQLNLLEQARDNPNLFTDAFGDRGSTRLRFDIDGLFENSSGRSDGADEG